MNNKNNKDKKYKNLSCPKCKSESIIKKGFRKTQNRGKLQRFSCKDCGFRFVENDGFYRMKNNKQKITLCLDLFYRGVSTRQVQSHLQAFYPHNSSHMTIYRWIVKYSKMISAFTDKLKLRVGKEIQVDEMEIGKKSSKYNGWFIDSIDTETRFIVASEFAKSRGQKEIKKVILNAKKKTKKQIKIYTTDGFTTYENVIKSVVGYYNLKKGLIKHNKVTQLKNEGFNHRIERLHNSVRHRIKTFRGFHGSVNSANSIMKGYEIFYNFIRPHLALKSKTPSELALPEMKLGVNKWLDLIKLANTNNLK